MFKGNIWMEERPGSWITLVKREFSDRQTAQEWMERSTEVFTSNDVITASEVHDCCLECGYSEYRILHNPESLQPRIQIWIGEEGK